MALTTVFGVWGAARAENECGRPEDGAITCSPANYEAATDGSILYHFTEADEDNIVIRFVEGLSIRYDLTDPHDDYISFPDIGVYEGDPLYSAVRIETNADYEGDIHFTSYADVTSNGRGISVAHNGKSGALRTEILGGSFSIDSEWSLPHAIHSYRADYEDISQILSGDHDLIVRDIVIESEVNPDTDEGWTWNGGIVGVQGGEGHLNSEGYLNITVQDSTIQSSGLRVGGIVGVHSGKGNVNVDVQNVHIDVSGSEGSTDGIFGYHLGLGDSHIEVEDTTINVRGNLYSNGINYTHWSQDSVGNLSVDARDVDIDVRGQRHVDGIFGHHRGTGDIGVDVHRAKITTIGADSGGIAFIHDGGGHIEIDARDVDIKVDGDRSVGIGGGQRYEGTGNVDINVHDSTVLVTGENVASIRSFNFSGEGNINIHVDSETTITAEGPGSSGILVGLTGRLVDDRTGPIKAPAGVSVPEDESGGNRGQVRGQSVVVDGRVRGGSVLTTEEGPVVGAGVRLYGGGRVEVGSSGVVGADSGVALRAEGEGAVLRVDVELAGRPLDEVVTGQISNDDGMTTIVVNGTRLHDDRTGITGTAHGGARDVSLAAAETVKGQAFLPIFVETYAPRAAVYEALPGFMLRLDQGGGTSGRRLRLPGSPLWIKVAGGQGSYEPDRSHVGAAYDFDRFATEVGAEFALSRKQNLTGWASLRHVQGSAAVSAPTGGGEIEAGGFGASAGASWENSAGTYASGSVSLARYDTDLHADGRGPLKEGADATAHTFGVEAGRRFSLADHLSITPQAWFTHADISMDDFRDAVESQVSLQRATQSTLGLGVVTETAHSWDDGKRTLALRAWLGVEQVLGGAETTVDVSGERLGWLEQALGQETVGEVSERLGSEAAPTRVMLGLGAAYHWDRWSLGGEVAASALGSDDNHHTASLRLGMQF